MLGNQRMAETTKSPEWEDLSEAEQKSVLKSSKVLEKDTPGYNKWDESLYQYKSIVLPEGTIKDFPRGGMDDKSLPSEVQRFDLPDGRVILRLNKQPEAVS